MDQDILYHLALGSGSHDLVEMFGDVKVSPIQCIPNSNLFLNANNLNSNKSLFSFFFALNWWAIVVVCLHGWYSKANGKFRSLHDERNWLQTSNGHAAIGYQCVFVSVFNVQGMLLVDWWIFSNILRLRLVFVLNSGNFGKLKNFVCTAQNYCHQISIDCYYFELNVGWTGVECKSWHGYTVPGHLITRDDQTNVPRQM